MLSDESDLFLENQVIEPTAPSPDTDGSIIRLSVWEDAKSSVGSTLKVVLASGPANGETFRLIPLSTTSTFESQARDEQRAAAQLST